MAGNKYLQVGSLGFPEEASSIQSSAGAGDAGKIPALDSSGKLDSTMFPASLGTDSQVMTAGEALSAGNLVYIDNATGKAFKADGTSITKAAVGFVLASALTNASVTVYFEGQLTGLSSLSLGAPYFLSDSATGAVTATPPTASASIVQYIGRATSTTAINFEADLPIKRA